LVNYFVISGHKDKQIISTDVCFDNTLVYLDSENYYEESDPLGWIPGIIIYNTISKSTICYKFETNVRSASYKNTTDTIYYVISKYKPDTICLEFKRVDCFKRSEKEIFSLEFDATKLDEKQLSILKHVDIHGINSRYCIVRIPELNHKYGLPQYSQILLLDSEENRCFVIPMRIANEDTILRLDRVVASDNAAFLLMKTGNIGWFEKLDFWKTGRKDYFDKLESLIFIDIESLIHHIKNGIEISDRFIIDKCGFESAFTNIEIIGDELKYQKVSFEDNTTELLSYNIVEKQTTKIKVEGIHENVVQFDGNMYAISTDENSKKINDISNNECIFTTATLAEQIIYFDNKNIITAIPQEGLRHEIKNYNIVDNKVNSLGFGWFTFNDRQKILTIFN
jgi:hypothetical protein